MAFAGKIRPARAGEASLLTDLVMRSKASNGYDEAFMAAAFDELSVTDADIAAGSTWVAEIDGKPAGVLTLSFEPATGLLDVDALFIDAERMRRGAGRALWDVVLSEAGRLGAGRIGLDSDPEAVAFYKAMGLQIVGESPSGSIPGRMLPRMEVAVV